MRPRFLPTSFAIAVTTISGAIGYRALEATPVQTGASKDPAVIARGAYLVGSMGCHDCHTPWQMGPKGQEPDMTRALTGHPQDIKVPAAPKLPEGWAWAGSPTNTAFAGPWGISFTANLTPDPETGLGKWTQDMFITALRTGRHEGKGRPILPPMPWPMYGKLNDADLRAVFAYLQSLPPVKNRVPQPVDPPEAVR
jgi:mono/diheme cytochrome c family protein